MTIETVPAGPPAAFADQRVCLLYDVHGASLHRLLLPLTHGDRQAAEDIVWETLLRATRHGADLTREVSQLGSWLSTVARRLAMVDGRTRRTGPPGAAGTPGGAAPAGGGCGDDPTVPAGPLVRAVRNLAPEQRAVLCQLFLHRRSVREAGEILGISEATTRARAHQALRALRRTC